MTTTPLDHLNLSECSTSELEALRGIFHDAMRHNRQKVLVALNGFVSTQEMLRAIDDELKKPKHQRPPEPDSAA